MRRILLVGVERILVASMPDERVISGCNSPDSKTAYTSIIP